MRVQCPECDAWFRLPGSVKLWDTTLCPECDTELQLIDLDPPELDYADYEEDDYDYDDDYDDDDY